MKKIMFNDDYGLTQAVLNGRKTMTRRIIKCPETYKGRPVKGLRTTGSKDIRLAVEMLVYNEECDDFVPMYIQPRYEIGEVIAVAQSYKDAGYDTHDTFGECRSIGSYPGWKNKRFVKAEYMPRHISITNIKIERLQDISDEDCLKEGIYEDSGDDEFPPSIFYEFEGNKDNGFDTPREAFAALIDKISGRGTWNNNLYTFAYEFELID
jgi:hypothetical protein